MDPVAGLRALAARAGELGRRLRARLARARLDAELAEEMRFHLELRERDNRAAGMSAEEARWAARRHFGNITLLREESRTMWSLGFVDTLLQDVRYGARSLGRAPGYTAVAAAALALGIGATSAVFTVVDHVLLRPLVYARPDRLVSLWSTPEGQPDARIPPSYPDYLDWRRRTGALSGAAFARGEVFALRGTEGRERVAGALVDDGFFPLLGVRPLLGRGFTPDEQQPAASRVLVLSHGLWSTRFAADPSIVGRELTLDSTTFTVVGVMPPGFGWPDFAQFWTPLAPAAAADPSLPKRDYRVDNRVLARMRPEVTVDRARLELAALSRQLAGEHPGTNDGFGVAVRPLRDEVVGDARQSLLVLAAAVAAVLLIACANVANLSLVRATARAREMAVRSALGAGRGRLVRQLLVESALLALAGGALGLLLAHWGVGALVAAAPAGLPRLDEIGVDLRVVAVTALASIVTALLFGLAPAAQAARGAPADALRGDRGTAGASRGVRRLRGALVVAEVAMALALLVGAGLLLRSFQRLREVPLGFDAPRLLALRIFAPAGRYDDPRAALALYDRLAERVAAIPGVERAGYANHMPLGMGSIGTRVLTGGDRDPDAPDSGATFRVVSAGYLETLGARLVAGRTLTERDLSPSSTALVINERLARQYFGGRSPLGERLTVFRQAVSRPDYNQPIHGEVVGVVADLQTWGPARAPDPEVFVPFTRNVWTSIWLVARARGAPGELTAAFRRAVTSVDPDIPVSEITTVAAVVDRQLARPRFNSALLSAFAVSALLLAATGIYGVLAYLVTQRTREIGVRVALGAQRGDVVRMVVREALLLVAAGIALGLVASQAMTRLVRGLLFEVHANDPLVHGAIVALLVTVALLATWIPARRAARVDPMVALREQ